MLLLLHRGSNAAFYRAVMDRNFADTGEGRLSPVSEIPIQFGDETGSRWMFRPAIMPVNAPAAAIAEVIKSGAVQPPVQSCSLPSNRGLLLPSDNPHWAIPDRAAKRPVHGSCLRGGYAMIHQNSRQPAYGDIKRHRIQAHKQCDLPCQRRLPDGHGC